MFTEDPQTRYDRQRRPRGPVVVLQLREMRMIRGLSIRDVVRRIGPRVDGRMWAPSTISLVERGERGASDELIEGLERALELPPGSVTREVPRDRGRDQ